MLDVLTQTDMTDRDGAGGEFLSIEDERYFAIRNVDDMAPFFVSVVSNSNHWLFVSSSGGLTAGRSSPEAALFPYSPVDKIHECTPHTGCKTLLRVDTADGKRMWEPFNRDQDGRYATSRHLYKNLLGNKLCFEEVNHDLQLSFRYTWMTSGEFGFSRQCELQNRSAQQIGVEVLDGLQNILPAGTPSATQATASNLVDAYKWTEFDNATGLAIYSLYSCISDRAEPSESLRANTVFCLGMDRKATLISSTQIAAFRAGHGIKTEEFTRGIRGAYFVNAELDIPAEETQRWQIIADVQKSQAQVAALRGQLASLDSIAVALADSIAAGSDELSRLLASADAFQLTAEENVTAHHYANTLFNVLRGGTFAHQYEISTRDFIDTLRHFNRKVFERNRSFLDELPDHLHFSTLLETIRNLGDHQLERICQEYLALTFGRRHGDPSRPWNKFAIRLTDDRGDRIYSYEGNWRDVFQNWEALVFSYPEFIENVIARFVNASTMDGYNPYRITKEGIDWEVENHDDPWSYIGYWGDHQIIYLQKLLELSRRFHPALLGDLLHRPIFSYANVPYRLKPFKEMLENPKSTIDFDHQLATAIDDRVQAMGADGKLVTDTNGDVYQVNLLEKLLVPLLSKLGNLVVDGGIWLNTQRPEWNDANNALVGHGLSMVTVNYLRRYVRLLQEMLVSERGTAEISKEIGQWLADTAAALGTTRARLGDGPVPASERLQSLQRLGQAASEYRQGVYRRGTLSGTTALSIESIIDLLDDSLVVLDHCIDTSKRGDGLYNAYNLLTVDCDSASIDTLYPMLEGQVAALSSGEIGPEDACELLEALFGSEMYRPDQGSFMLYPDRDLPGFLDKNRIPASDIESIPLLRSMLDAGDERLVTCDADGCYRFNPDFTNVDALNRQLEKLASELGEELNRARNPLQRVYEKVFNHRAFTGRSGGMFGFEGLGCIYWHMVSKLLLAVQENFFAAVQNDASDAVKRRLGEMYYRVREGIGFNKTPTDYGAFPVDPYSHTPKHAGAQQPGMTGQVKEEILTRFGELGVHVADGVVRFEPSLLRRCEFLAESRHFRYLDVDNAWRRTTIPARGIGFTWCQVPIIYELVDQGPPSISITRDNDRTDQFNTIALPHEESRELFQRSGRIRQIRVELPTDVLFDGLAHD